MLWTRPCQSERPLPSGCGSTVLAGRFDTLNPAWRTRHLRYEVINSAALTHRQLPPNRSTCSARVMGSLASILTTAKLMSAGPAELGDFVREVGYALADLISRQKSLA